MREYGLFLASALVTALTNAAGLPQRGRPLSRILVVKLDHLGDAITATPALRVLRDAHPLATIHLLLHPAVAPLFEESPLADGVLTYASPRFRRDGEPGAEAPAPPGAGERYDAIVELRGDRRTLVLPFRTRAFRRADRGTVRLWDAAARRLGLRRGAPLHEVETNLAIVRALLPRAARSRSRPGGAPPEIRVGPAALASMRSKAAAAGLDLSRPFAVLHPGAAWRPRAWRPERYAALAGRLAQVHGLQVAVVGSEGERDVERAMRAESGAAPAAWLFGSLTLGEAAALLGAARIFVGNDSGLAHLAAAVGAPVVALFGPQDPLRFGPRSPRARTLHHRVPCFPCEQVVCARPDLPCVNLIEASEVEAAITAALG